MPAPMKIALLGFESSGKKTLFSLLTGHAAPEFLHEGQVLEGQAFVRDERVDKLSALYKPKKTTHANIQFIVCPPVTTGTGYELWLKEARLCDLLCLVVRKFSNPEVFHPLGRIDLEADRQTIKSELILADLMLVEKRLDRIAKDKRRAANEPTLAVEEQLLQKCKVALEEEKPVSTLTFSDDEKVILANLCLITQKSILWCMNVDESEASQAPTHENEIIISAKIEKEISEITDAAERNTFMEELGLKESGLQKLTLAAYKALGLMSFYTSGEDEVRAWTIRIGTKAPQAGGKVHSDIERGFVRVEIMNCEELLSVGSEHKLKTLGKVHVKGKDYVIQDGDICHFLFAV